MRGRVIVDSEESYAAWIADQPTFAETQGELNTNLIAGESSYAVCSSCHGVNGEGNQAMHAPALAGMDAEYMRRQLRHFKRGVRGADESDTWGRTMAPMAMMLADAAAINNVVSYIGTLSGQHDFNDDTSYGLTQAVNAMSPVPPVIPTNQPLFMSRPVANVMVHPAKVSGPSMPLRWRDWRAGT